MQTISWCRSAHRLGAIVHTIAEFSCLSAVKQLQLLVTRKAAS